MSTTKVTGLKSPPLVVKKKDVMKRLAVKMDVAFDGKEVVNCAAVIDARHTLLDIAGHLTNLAHSSKSSLTDEGLNGSITNLIVQFAKPGAPQKMHSYGPSVWGSKKVGDLEKAFKLPLYSVLALWSA